MAPKPDNIGYLKEQVEQYAASRKELISKEKERRHDSGFRKRLSPDGERACEIVRSVPWNDVYPREGQNDENKVVEYRATHAEGSTAPRAL
jgi:hypothetical protein